MLCLSCSSKVFKFEGYELEEGKEPSIENVSVTVDGSNEFSWGGSFYGGLICGPDGRAVYADGSPTLMVSFVKRTLSISLTSIT